MPRATPASGFVSWSRLCARERCVEVDAAASVDVRHVHRKVALTGPGTASHDGAFARLRRDTSRKTKHVKYGCCAPGNIP